jgi:RND family efflux transporter MFP subunit
VASLFCNSVANLLLYLCAFNNVLLFKKVYMNRHIKSLSCLCAMLLFIACGAKSSRNHSEHVHEEAHSHEQCSHTHSHEAHDHSEQVAHNHADNCAEDHADHAHNHADEHNHSHAEAHSHEHNHNHGEGIAFTRKQAEDAGLVVEKIEEMPFYNVIKTAGHLQTPVGAEAVVVATSSGVLYYTQASLVEGQALNEGRSFAGISARKLQDGDPLMKAKLAYETAELEYERAQRLVVDKIISAKEFEQIRLRYETAKTTYEGQAKGMTEKGASVVSPITGYLKQLLVPNGSYVEVGQPVAVVTQTRRLQLRAEVSERDYVQLSKVTTANFRPAYTDKLYKITDLNGRLVAYGKSATDMASHYIPVTFEFDNVGDIIPGSYAEVYLLTAPEDGVVSVPVGAITEEQGLYFVYVQVCAEEFMKREVHLGRRNGERVEVLHGLHHGEHVVTRGAYQVKLASVATSIPHGHSH